MHQHNIFATLGAIADALRARGCADVATELHLCSHERSATSYSGRLTLWLHHDGAATSLEADSIAAALDTGAAYARIQSASDALALLDGLTALECEYDGPIPQYRRDDALHRIAAARAWMARHPAAVAEERERRREALLRATAAGDARWAEALPRRPDAAMVGRIA